MTTQYYAQKSDGLYLCERDHQMYLSPKRDDLYVCDNDKRIVGHLKAMKMNLEDFRIKEYQEQMNNKRNMEESFFAEKGEFQDKAEELLNGGGEPDATIVDDEEHRWAAYFVGYSPEKNNEVYAIAKENGGIESVAMYEENDNNLSPDELLKRSVWAIARMLNQATDGDTFEAEIRKFVDSKIMTNAVQPARKIRYHGNYYAIYHQNDTDCSIIMQVVGGRLRYVNFFCGDIDDNRAIAQFIQNEKENNKSGAGLQYKVTRVDTNEANADIYPVGNYKDKLPNGPQTLKLPEWVAHFEGIVRSGNDAKMEQLYEKNIVISLDGISTEIPFEAQSYNALYDFCRTIMVDTDIFQEKLKSGNVEKKMTEARTNAETYKGQLKDGTIVTLTTRFKHSNEKNQEIVELKVGDKVGRGVDSWYNRPWYKYPYENALRKAISSLGYPQDVVDITSTARGVENALGILCDYISDLL